MEIVVPHAGTWIEIVNQSVLRGGDEVVPHAGTWIEIVVEQTLENIRESRSPRGNVD